MPAPDLSKPRPKARSSTAKAKKDASGLGRAIINKRAKEQKRIYEEALHNTELPSGLHSVTQENDLDEFLNTAQLAATDFSAERQNIRVLPSTSVIQQNPYLLTATEETELAQRHTSNKKRLKVPRRPAWNRDLPKEELERRERDEFLEWRKGLADIEDREELLLTPFERNLSVWRQLWRTIERSHLIVQIVDARNPLGFRCEDLETYVKEVGIEVSEEESLARPGIRRNLLLINKADLLTEDQRRAWANYFSKLHVAYAFFSAKAAAELQEEGSMIDEDLLAIGDESSDDNETEEDDSVQDFKGRLETEEGDAVAGQNKNQVASDDELAEGLAEDVTIQDPPLFDRTQVLTVEELEELFLRLAPDLQEFASQDQPTPKFCVGLVGYPNVGKSSTINALVGQKKVSVSSTPGKTKNFQTIHLSPEIVLCDCPGLVFPQFATTKAGMVCDGVLPIDQMREHTGPIDLVTRRIPKQILEGIYGIHIPMLPLNEGGTGVPTAPELLSVYAVARGFFTQGQGNPDESRASRYILKDYVSAKLLYCHPPPGIDSNQYNSETRDLIKMALSQKLRSKRAPTNRVGKKSATFVKLPNESASDEKEMEEQTEASQNESHSVTSLVPTLLQNRPRQSARADTLDRDFLALPISSTVFVNGIAANSSGQTSRTTMYPHQRQLGSDGARIPTRKLRELESLGAIQAGLTKKHYKGNKRQKARSGAGYD